MTLHSATLALLLTLLSSQAQAASCDQPVSGYREGQVIRGVLHSVWDSDTFRISRPGGCLRIRTSDFDGAELSQPGGKYGRDVLRRYVGRPMTCTVARGRTGNLTSHKRLMASCSIDGVPVRSIHRRAGTREGGR